jgi:ABC-type transport system involved in multi-copper enzyme maturation permease subunit
MRGGLTAIASGISAVGSKELRGRMRGPRAFIAVTFYLVLLAGFAVMVYLLQQQSAAQQAAWGGGNPYVSAQLGQAIFTVLLFLQVLLIVFLAPAATAGAISLEREKQTLDLLAATPVSTLAIVVGKLASALAFVVVLILASIPLTAIVFVFGGVAPEDILRGYVVLLVTALGFGSVGIFLSSLTRRTQSATILTYLVVLVLTVGTAFTWWFWDTMAGQQQQAALPMRELAVPGVAVDDASGLSAVEPSPSPKLPEPPEALLWLNPVVAAVDVICGTDVNSYSTACQIISGITGQQLGVAPFSDVPQVKPGANWGGAVPAPGVVVQGGVAIVGDPTVVAVGNSGSGSTRDTFWPKAAVAWVATSLLLVVAAVQLVSPTRRWRIFRRPRRREARP